MRKLFLSLAAITAIHMVSCDDRYKVLSTYNDPPTIKIIPETPGVSAVNKDGKFVSDSVKLSGNSNYFPFRLEATDPNENIKNIFYSSTASGKLLFNDNEIDPNSPISLIDNYLVLRFAPSAEGLNRLSFQVVDRFDESDTATLELTAFKNLIPVCSLGATLVGNVSPYEWQFSGSDSYDADKNFGGVIQYYIFTVNSEMIKTTKPTINYIFPEPGNYTVKLQVQDNDSALSKIEQKQITVN